MMKLLLLDFTNTLDLYDPFEQQTCISHYLVTAYLLPVTYKIQNRLSIHFYILIQVSGRSSKVTQICFPLATSSNSSPGQIGYIVPSVCSGSPP